MEAIDDLIKTLQRLKQTLPDMAVEVLEENKELIEDMNIEQLRKGQRADGSYLPDYSISSVRKYGKRPGPITLENKGDYYRGKRARVTREGLIIDDTDDKADFLSKTYGAEIDGVNDENIEVIKETMIVPGMIEKINNFIANEQF